MADLADDLLRRYLREPSRIEAMRGEPLDPAIRARYERQFGVDLSHVRVVTGVVAEAIARERGADALTIGNTGLIVMGGSPDRAPSTAAGRALLAHELVHVAQARASGGRPFAPEDEHAAEQVEQAVIAAATAPAAASAAAGMPAADRARRRDARHARRIEAVRARVLELVEDADLSHRLRGGTDC
jgi:hypothetical protein|nr:DUF4157 domain-containing protein [Kofleriaceae bacterium]